MNFDYTSKLGRDGFFIEEADVHAWCKAMGIIQYHYAYSDFHQAMALSVNGNVDLENKLDQLNQLPVRFDHIKGGLWLEDNQLTSLVGLPQNCRTIHLHHNPLSFEALMPLSQVQGMQTIYLPLEFKKMIEKTEFKIYKSSFYIGIPAKSISDFQSFLLIDKLKNEKELIQKEYLKQNQASLLALNQSFQQKTLFKVKRYDF